MQLRHFPNYKSRNQQVLIVLFVVIVGVAGTILLRASHAATAVASVEAESKTPTTPAALVADTTASGAQAVLFGSTVQAGQFQPDGVPGNHTLKFDDEFNGTTLDSSKWSSCWFSPSCGTMNNVTTSSSNVSVSGGNLILTLASSSSGAAVSSNPRGGASTGYQYQYGVVEARVSFPGDGTSCYNWPAWWTDAQSWPTNGENDIAEILGGSMTINYHSPSGSHNHNAPSGYWCGGFHIYTMDREAGQVTVYYDGVKAQTYSTDDDGGQEYLVVNVGASSHPAYGTASQVKVDYVRAWQ